MNKLIINQAAALTITMGAFTVFTIQYYFSHYVQYNYKFNYNYIYIIIIKIYIAIKLN
jgi:hypothetical protein